MKNTTIDNQERYVQYRKDMCAQGNLLSFNEFVEKGMVRATHLGETLYICDPQPKSGVGKVFRKLLKFFF